MDSTAILLPVLNRPNRVEPLLINLAEATPEPHTPIFAASDLPTVRKLRRCQCPLLVDGGGTWPRRINRLISVTHHPYVFLGADDLLFHRGWLSAAMDIMERVDGVVVVNDLHNPNGTAALVSRRYIEEECDGRLLHEGYGHNWSDTECFSRARARERWAYAADSIVEHLHWETGKSEWDSTYEKGMATNEQDMALYASREHLWQ